MWGGLVIALARLRDVRMQVRRRGWRSRICTATLPRTGRPSQCPPPAGRSKYIVRDNVRRMTPRDWDATTYERLSAPMTAMGTDVLDRLVLRGDETVLDAGCGTGNVTRAAARAAAARARDRGRRRAVDGRAGARAAAAGGRRPPGRPARARLDEPVDAILSTATFHWIARPRPAVREPARGAAAGRPARRPVRRPRQRRGGQAGRVRRGARSRRSRAYFDGWDDRLDVRDARGHRAAAARRRLHRRLVLAHARRRRPGRPAGYLRAICLGSFLDRLPEELREPFVAAALERLPDPLEIHYVRLNILARA